ncbi:MAG TPA: hypothetical protein VEV85_20970 [Bryobacteraceae bacterium]|nr:hypothetical protein [Bryobacteraceae bacterium]
MPSRLHRAGPAAHVVAAVTHACAFQLTGRNSYGKAPTREQAMAGGI